MGGTQSRNTETSDTNEQEQLENIRTECKNELEELEKENQKIIGDIEKRNEEQQRQLEEEMRQKKERLHIVLANSTNRSNQLQHELTNSKKDLQDKLRDHNEKLQELKTRNENELAVIKNKVEKQGVELQRCQLESLNTLCQLQSVNTLVQKESRIVDDIFKVRSGQFGLDNCFRETIIEIYKYKIIYQNRNEKEEQFEENAQLTEHNLVELRTKIRLLEQSLSNLTLCSNATDLPIEKRQNLLNLVADIKQNVTKLSNGLPVLTAIVKVRHPIENDHIKSLDGALKEVRSALDRLKPEIRLNHLGAVLDKSSSDNIDMAQNAPVIEEI